MKAKLSVVVLAVAVMFVMLASLAKAEPVNVTGPKNFQGDVYIKGVKLTASAAQINAAAATMSGAVTNVTVQTKTITYLGVDGSTNTVDVVTNVVLSVHS